VRAAALGVSGAAFLLFFGTLVAFWYRYVRTFYFPSDDEFALFVNSARPFHPSIANWFLQGFSQYFMSYPQWSSPITNFFRPTANATYYIGSLVYG
jgi:hypothetical protein